MPRHVEFLVNSNSPLQTSDDQQVEIIELLHTPEDGIMAEWATHLRNHYCADGEIDVMRRGTGQSRSAYLEDTKFPSLGSIRSADFAEIIVADYIQFVSDYEVPRTRYEAKTNRNTSPHGIDVIAFKMVDGQHPSAGDELLTCEVKAALQRRNTSTLSRALGDSKKDYSIRKPESLNAIKQRLKDKGRDAEASLVERYQNKTDEPYQEISGAAVVHSNHTWDESVVTSVSCSDHPNRSALFLLAVKGERLMDLASALYGRACHEA